METSTHSHQVQDYLKKISRFRNRNSADNYVYSREKTLSYLMDTIDMKDNNRSFTIPDEYSTSAKLMEIIYPDSVLAEITVTPFSSEIGMDTEQAESFFVVKYDNKIEYSHILGLVMMECPFIMEGASIVMRVFDPESGISIDDFGNVDTSPAWKSTALSLVNGKFECRTEDDIIASTVSYFLQDRDESNTNEFSYVLIDDLRDITQMFEF